MQRCSSSYRIAIYTEFELNVEDGTNKKKGNLSVFLTHLSSRCAQEESRDTQCVCPHAED